MNIKLTAFAEKDKLEWGEKSKPSIPDIPDAIYDEYYFSSKENQELILRVVETYQKDLIKSLLHGSE